MASIIIPKTLDITEKLRLMQEDARFDVADGDAENPAALANIRESIKSPAPPPRVPKVFLSNDCIFNCAYCGCRQSNECAQRYASTPRELATLAVQQARRSRHGIFITSAIIRNPDYTEELIIKTLKIIRQEMGYGGYVHAKVMPGTDPGLIREAGLYANRLSVNIEVAKSEGYAMIARNKNKGNILTPMGQISDMIRQAKGEGSRYSPSFATSQTTQLMAGSTNEDDFTILNLASALYRKYRLSRVYYTAFHLRHQARGYEDLESKETPHWRMARLYQADRLMELYGFTPQEIAPADTPFLSESFDPKAAWAIRNLHLFPVEVNKADYEMLIRVPGIGLTYAKRILKARQQCTLTHDGLRALGVSLKRSCHFITCNGKYTGDTCENDRAVARLLCEQPPGRDAASACG